MVKLKTTSKGSSKSSNKSTDSSNKSSKASRSAGKSKSNKKKSKTMDSTEDDYQFRYSLEADGLTIADMAADGNCLFRSLSDQLYGDYGNRHEEIRSDICDYMESNKEDFKLFLVLDDDSCEEGDDGKDFEGYIQKMRDDGEWGGNLELVAAARLYQRKVTVFSATLSAYSIEPGDEKPSGPDILVSFHDNDHYNSVRNDKSPPKAPPKLNKQKKVLSPSREPSEGLSDITATTATTTTTSSTVSDVSLDRNSETNSDKILPKKSAKKSSPCPCGSGQRYKKCCHAKEKHNSRLEKFKEKILGDDKKLEQEVVMKGNFRVLQI